MKQFINANSIVCGSERRISRKSSHCVLFLSASGVHNGWHGNQYVSVAEVSKIGKVAGVAGLAIGTAADAVGVSRGAIPLSKAATNFGVGGAAMLIGGEGGAAIGAVYFGIDSFFPGGWSGFGKWTGSILPMTPGYL